jgi:hypothetical protein
MTSDGVLSINLAWWEPEEPEVLEKLVATVKTAFPVVVAITGISEQSGAVLLAGGPEASAENIVKNAKLNGHLGLIEITSEISREKSPKLEFTAGLGEPLIDDRAQLDKIVDRMYMRTRELAFAREAKALGISNVSTDGPIDKLTSE